MAGWFTHLLIADAVAEKMGAKPAFLAEEPSLNDFIFGSIAPDVRYMAAVEKKETHVPNGDRNAFRVFKSNPAFAAGYQIHLIADQNWGEVVDFFGLKNSSRADTFGLNFGVDRFFQENSDPSLSSKFYKCIANSNAVPELKPLGFNFVEIAAFKLLVSTYISSHDLENVLPFLKKLNISINKEVIEKVLSADTKQRKS